jgi:hypothetical protein
LQQWAAREPAEQYLKRFAFGVKGISPQLSLHVMGHEEDDGHTLYEVQCSLAWFRTVNEAWDNSEAYACYLRDPPIAWKSKHRLQDLRECLHDNVKKVLGDQYGNLFEGRPFARHGGPPGTTARLRLWLDALAKLINTNALPPCMSARTLRFLEAPVLEKSEAALLVSSGRCAVCTLPFGEELRVGKLCNRCHTATISGSMHEADIAANAENGLETMARVSS